MPYRLLEHTVSPAVPGGRHGRVVSVKAGDRHYALEVVEERYHAPYDHRVFACRCDCGNETVVRLDHLRRGETRTCGCAIGRPYKTPPTVEAPEVPMWTTTAQQTLDAELRSLSPFGGATAGSRRNHDVEDHVSGRAVIADDLPDLEDR